MAVTNNHVVTGAASIQVYFDDDTEARNARLLGISECSDLAMIDVAGDGYRYFDWYEGDPHPGLPVYAAGFPLGEPKFNLNQGIVSQENAASETVWASFDSAIEHDANINPGNSGGPLMDQNGRVVGVNYAKSSMTNQSLAISTREVLGVLDQLAANEDVDSIGVNGEARVSDEDGTTGIYVHSVASGSPAERAGIRGGDFITQLEGIPLAEDETMSTYCDMLRSRTSQDVIKIQVLRQDTGELLEGQINGVPLQVVSGGETTVPEANEETTGPGETVGSGGYPDYTTLTDQSGALSVEIPAEWEDVSDVASELNEVPVAQLAAAPDLEDWQDLKSPGVWFVAAQELAQQFTVEELLDATDYSGNCEERTREEYYDGAYTGLSDSYAGCGPGAVDLQVVSAAPDDREFLVLVVVAQLDERDEEAWDRIRATFLVDRTELTR